MGSLLAERDAITMDQQTQQIILRLKVMVADYCLTVDSLRSEIAARDRRIAEIEQAAERKPEEDAPE